MDGRVHSPEMACEVLLEHEHDAVRVTIGQAAHERAVDDAEHRRRQADADGERDDGDEGEAEVLAERAAAEADVAGEGGHDTSSRGSVQAAGHGPRTPS